MRPARPNRRYQIALWMDRHLGSVLCRLLLVARRLTGRRPTPSAEGRIDRVLVLKFWGVGSIVLASPLLAALRSRYPDARIDFVTLRGNDPVLRMYPQVGRRFTLDLGRGIPRFFAETIRTIGRVRRERYDLLLDLEFFTSYSAIFSCLSNARVTRGFSAKGSARGRLHDVEVPFNAYHHVSANFLTLLEGDPMRAMALTQGNRPIGLPPLHAGADAAARCTRELAAHPAWRDGRPIVVLNPNAGDMALERRWPAERAAELLRRLVALGRLNLVLTGSDDERSYVESIETLAGAEGRVIVLAGRLDLEGFVALLERAAVVITNDSGPLHLARAAGAAVVALFGPETPVLYGPLSSREDQPYRVHYRGLACSPCMNVHENKVLSCWFAQARCMTEIDPEDVFASVGALLDAASEPAARASRGAADALRAAR